MIEAPLTFNGLTLNDQSVRSPSRVLLGTATLVNGSDEVVLASASFDEYGALLGTPTQNLSLLIDHALFIPDYEPFIITAQVSVDTVRVDRVIPATSGSSPVEIWKSEPYLRVSEITGLDDPDVRYEAQEISGSDGENPSETFYGGRSIGLAFQIRAWNLIQLRHWEDRVKQAFGDLLDHDLEYTPRGKATRAIAARKVQKLDITDVQDGPMFWRNVVVGLRAARPLALGPTANDQLIDQFGLPAAYRTYPLIRIGDDTREYPRTYTPTTAADPRRLNHPGSYKAWPTTRIHGPVTNPTITNSTVQKSIIFTDLVINEGTFVEIDHETGIVKWYGYDETYLGLDIVNSEFWWLAPGDNVVTIEADAFSTASGAKLEVFWRDTYL